ncbi:hypothetical protein DFA_08473 [Cavenderia fasciculata]|uniref:Transmembrane protein n=1 Tax=Cavenderia fasciculata TaxID=261658 RepID=F4Q6A3_CACFS|nr:uncharacterized protein DFA_08473 [Cavenderia fasciculata]EGG17477.1 hypothetical protein DFA_08473 [Cavenderia fasciculata]|eukprot:XP_004355961.1 hypothetical protein DFA_08473 [Cavenderia fasciculata]
MNKSIILSIVLLFTFISISYCGINTIVQNGKVLTITHSPMTMIWFEQQVVLNGMKTNIKPYCKSLYGWSPVVCTLPSVPACDTIRLYGSAGIGATNLQMLSAFNCTVLA